MGIELESRLEKIGIHKMSMKDALKLAEQKGDTVTIARIKKLISFDLNLAKSGRRPAVKTVAVEVTKKTTGAAKPLSKAGGRNAAGRRTAKKAYATK